MASRQPFSRHHARGGVDGQLAGDHRTRAERLFAAYGLLAAEYQWSVRQIRSTLTDELLVLYLDDAIDRRSDRMEADFESTVEAVRVGYLTARDNKLYQKWSRRRSTPKRGTGLTGQALEQAVMRIASMFPENVQRVTA